MKEIIKFYTIATAVSLSLSLMSCMSDEDSQASSKKCYRILYEFDRNVGLVEVSRTETTEPSTNGQKVYHNGILVKEVKCY